MDFYFVCKSYANCYSLAIGKTIYVGTVKGDEYNVSKMLKKLHSSKGATPPPTA